MRYLRMLKRYEGQPLGLKPRISVLGGSKVGNFMVTLPLLRSLKKVYPESLVDYWGSEVTRELELAFCKGDDRLIDWRTSWDQDTPDASEDILVSIKDRGRPDLAINCDGYNPFTKALTSLLRPKWVVGGSLTRNFRETLAPGSHQLNLMLSESDWDSQEFLQRHKTVLRTNYIGEIVCRMAFLEPGEESLALNNVPYKIPDFPVPDLLIHCTSTRSAKSWFVDGWISVIDWCYENEVSVGLIGAAPALQESMYNAGNVERSLIESYNGKQLPHGKGPLVTDLRGKTSLLELVGCCKKALGVVSVDSGPLHIAIASGAPTLAVVGNDRNGVGASPIRLWLPRSENLSRTVSSATCDGCAEAHFKNKDCLKSSHICMEAVNATQVQDWLAGLIGGHRHGKCAVNINE